MNSNEYLMMFIDESKDHLQALNENLLALEGSPEDLAVVQNIFRSAHTLKGMAATMGFDDIASLTHEMENVLDLVRNQKLNMNPTIFDSLFKSLDALESMVEDIVGGGKGKLDVSSNVQELAAISSGNVQTNGKDSRAVADMLLDEYQYSVLMQSIESGHAVMYIKVMIEESCLLKAARAYMVFDLLERNGEIIKSSPSVQDIEQEKFDQQFAVYYISNMRKEELEQALLHISEIQSVEVVSLEMDALAELLPDKNSRQSIKEVAAVAESQAKSGEVKGGHGSVSNRTIRVDIDRLDMLMNLFSELLIDRVRLQSLAEEIKRNDLLDTVEHMTRVSTDLQNIVLKLRMVPVESVFNRFPRMVRDLAKSLNKKVELTITGAETELDRTVIDEIGDPLVHLLRNAVDHGIEEVNERIRAGKPEAGKVHLQAFHSGNHVFIEIEDDGGGIDRDKVMEKAIDRGLITKEQALQLSDEEIYSFLFESGFSTAEIVSDVSGRGVGLDVVRSKIQALSGEIVIHSRLGQGTRFSVKLPLTLSIISAMLIRIGEEKYAIPLSSIVETAILQKQSIQNVHNMKMVMFRDHLIPILSLKQVLDLPEEEDENEQETNMIVVKKGDKMAALIVDELIGQQEIVLKSLGNYLSSIFAISGATILGDGHVALIIDANALVK